MSNGKTIDAISIYNVLGQEVIQTKPNSISTQINVGSLKAGTYFVKAASGDAVKTFKLIKQ